MSERSRSLSSREEPGVHRATTYRSRDNLVISQIEFVVERESVTGVDLRTDKLVISQIEFVVERESATGVVCSWRGRKR